MQPEALAYQGFAFSLWVDEFFSQQISKNARLLDGPPSFPYFLEGDISLFGQIY
jgi:hypothetical protein